MTSTGKQVILLNGKDKSWDHQLHDELCKIVHNNDVAHFVFMNMRTQVEDRFEFLKLDIQDGIIRQK